MRWYKKILNIKYWFLSRENIDELDVLKNNNKGKKEISLYSIFSVAGNFLPIIISLLFFFFSSDFFREGEVLIEVIRFLNKGSIPLVCYSLIISGIVFLLDKSKPGHKYLRKKVLGVSILLMFFNVSLYTFLTASELNLRFEGHVFIFVFSLFLLFNTIEFTKSMILLQDKIVSYKDGFEKLKAKLVIKKSSNIDKIDFD